MGNRYHVEAVTPHSMFVEWTRDYDDNQRRDLMSALVNGDPWGAADLKLTRVTAVKG